ncbi:PilN domain-containing protein [Pontiellaceae bacterium B12219]|nr:PilN domain-containing protein [Pontiellaceae bacterium B12219]
MTGELVKTEYKASGLVTADPVRLVASARFIVETLELPPGISPRDTQGFLEGEVEERSLFPLESTSWGYMENRRKGANASILLYSAFREQVNGESDPHYAQRHAVLPGFAALVGRAWRKTTWIFLQETECLTLLRFPARSEIPDRVRSLYGTNLEEDPAAAWILRDTLLKGVEVQEDECIEEGLVRCSKPSNDRKGGVIFPLERCRAPGEEWKRFGTGKISSEAALRAADVRDPHFLNKLRNRRRAARQLNTFLRLAAVLLIGLSFFQFRYIQLKKKTARLSDQVSAQRPVVSALQQQEALAKSAGRFADPPLEIFAWLTAVNDIRPENISFLSTYADRDGNLGFSGEAPSVADVNKFKEGLNQTNRFSQVEVKEINSAKRGVKFSIQVKMNTDVQPLEGGDA